MRRAASIPVVAFALLALAAAPAAAESPAGVVRAYVRALSERDSNGLCGLLAPFAQARVGAAVKEEPNAYEAAIREPKLCPLAADVFVGYFGEGEHERWAGARVVSVGRPHRVGKLTVVPMRVRNDYVPVDPSGRDHSTLLNDRVYLVRLNGHLRLAKLSRVADAAALGWADGAPALTPPNLDREWRWYRLRLARDHVEAQRERATAAAPFTDCSRVAPLETLADPLGDVSSNMAAGQSAWPPWVDVHTVGVGRLGGTLCVNFDLGAPVRTRTFYDVVFYRGRHRALTVSGARIRPGRAVVALDDSAVSGELGVDGSRLSLLVRRRDIPAGERWVLARAGGFWGTTIWMKMHGLLATEGPQYEDEFRR